MLVDLENYLSFYFVSTEKTNTTFTSTVINTVNCLDKYKEEYPNYDISDQFMKTSEHMTEWICPDVKEFYLLNNPETYSDGKNFKLVVDYCDSMSNPDCVTDEVERENFIKQITIQSKVVSQFFNPDVFVKTR